MLHLWFTVASGLLSSTWLLQLSSIGVPNEEDNRRALRELLFSAPGVEDHISGVVSTLPAIRAFQGRRTRLPWTLSCQRYSTMPKLISLRNS